MKKSAALLALCGLALGHASLAAANPADATDRAKFYDFGIQVIDAEVKKPATELIVAQPRPIFDRLLKLKKSMRPALRASCEDRALK